MFKTIHNVETGEITTIELAGDELAEFLTKEAEAKEAEKKFAKELANAKSEATRRAADRAALLLQLGITEEQAKLLIG